MSNRYIVVIRDTVSGKQIACTLTDNLPRLFRKILRQRGEINSLRGLWHSAERDAYIESHYRLDMSAAAIAEQFTSDECKITKNMVIRRAEQLGLAAVRAVK